MGIKQSRGSLTVEAVLILPIFLGAILFISFLTKAYLVHEVVQDALNQTAVQLASCSYPNSLSGGNEHELANLAMVMDVIYSGTKASNDSGSNADLTDHMRNILNSQATETNATAVVMDVCESVFEEQLSEKFISSIAGGVEGISLKDSNFYDENQNIELVAHYTLKSVDPFGFIKNIPLENRVLIRAWMGGI